MVGWVIVCLCGGGVVVGLFGGGGEGEVGGG